jgi:putative tryptophan/tyrosine transport system substrate-binding protein
MKKWHLLGWAVALGMLLSGLAAGGWCASSAYAAKVKMLLGRSTGPYEEVRKSIQSNAGFDVEATFISGKANLDKDIVSGLSPDTTSLVLALGTQALTPAAKLDTRIPLVYTLVFDPATLPDRTSSGVVIQIGIKEQLEKLKALFPERKEIGVLFNPIYSQEQVNRARDAADGMGITLLVVPVEKTADLSASLDRLQAGSAELIWMFADQTIVHPQSVKIIAEFSRKKKIPLIGLSLFHVQNGAFAAFSVDFNDIGRQTVDLAKRTLNGDTSPVVETPRKVIIYVSRQVKEQMQIKDMVEVPQIQYVP